MGFFSFTRSKSSASAAAKKAPNPEDSWLHEAVIRFLQGPMYTHPLMSFIDHHCAVFDDEDENKLEYTSIHADFKRLVETLLSEFLVEVGVPPARFVQVVADSAGGELNDFVLNSILTVDDFVQFKAMMVRRNVDLTEEVLELHRSRAAAQAAATAADAPSSPAPSTPDPAVEHPPTSPLDRSVDDDGFHRAALAQAEAASAASAADLDALATRLERDARRAADTSAREAALARAVPEFEDDTTAPEPDDGFDKGALEQAMKLSEAQFEADKIAKRERATRRAEEASEAAAKAAATAEAARAMADAAAATERAVLAQARADPNYDAGFLLRARAQSAEAAAKAAEAAESAARAQRESKVGGGGGGGGSNDDDVDDDLRRAMEESAAVAAREAEEADRERRELEEALAASLALAGSPRESPGASGSGNPPSVTSSPATKPTASAGVVDRLGKAPLGKPRAVAGTGLPPVAGALRPVQKIAPATNAAGKGSGALRGAGYKPPASDAAVVVPGSDLRAVREAAAAAAASQRAIVAEKEAKKDAEEAEKDADANTAALAAAAAAASLRGMDAVRREQYVAEQRQLLLARKAAERERELAEFAANGQSHFVNPLFAESGRASPDAEGDGDADAGRSDEEQRAKREALRAELAKQMKAELARRNDWTVEEVA